VETIFESFCVLISQHPTIFRPYGNQIKVLVRPYLAPTLCDRHFIPLSLSQSARRVAVLLYQTSAKNSSGEEWEKGIRALVKDIHGTVDQVYRAVIEDWESTTGYINRTVDINKEVQGGAKSEDDLPAWNGIDGGIQRLEGMLRLLKEHFMHQTSTAVNVPLDLVVDLLTRLMSVVAPTNVKGSSDHDGVRLHPAIERNERDGLWAGLKNIHVVSMELYLVLVDRLQHNFTSLAQRCLSQVAWLFSSHSHDEALRCTVYNLMARILPLCGASLNKSAVDLLTPAMRTCCKEFPLAGVGGQSRSHDETGKHTRNGSSANADTFLNVKTASETVFVNSGSEVLSAASKLLPVLLSHLPQQYLEGYLRAKIDQTAVLTQNKEAMLASVLNPYIGKNGRALPSILPHLCRAFPNDPAVEALLRPRLPVLWQNQAISHEEELEERPLQEADDLMEDVVAHNEVLDTTINIKNVPISGHEAAEGSAQLPKASTNASHDHWGGASHAMDAKIEKFSLSLPPPVDDSNAKLSHPVSVPDEQDEGDDSDESVHLNMDLSDLEDDSVS